MVVGWVVVAIEISVWRNVVVSSCVVGTSDVCSDVMVARAVVVASDVCSTVVVPRNVAVTRDTCIEVSVVISRADNEADALGLVEAAAGGGVQVVMATSGKQVESEEMHVSGRTSSWQGSKADDAVVMVTVSRFGRVKDNTRPTDMSISLDMLRRMMTSAVRKGSTTRISSCL